MSVFTKGVLAIIIITAIAMTTLFYLITAPTPLLKPNPEINAQQVTKARTALGRIARQLKGDDDKLDVVINQDEIDGLANLAASTLKRTRIEAFIQNQQLTAAVSFQPYESRPQLFINAYCTFSQGTLEFKVEYCQVGQLPISASVANWLISKGLTKLLGPELGPSFERVAKQIDINDDQLRLFTQRPEQFNKHKLKQSLVAVSQSVTSDYLGIELNPESFTAYVEVLKAIQIPNQSLAYYTQPLFEEVKNRTANLKQIAAYRKRTSAGDVGKINTSIEIIENRAAIWALASFFGDPRFAQFAGLNFNKSSKSPYTPTLSGRTDLALHFLYSAVLDQIGGSDFGFKIGELKELNDSDFGGSGYSFADLAADKAGIMFSQRLTASTSSAMTAQQYLANKHTENSYFPSIDNLPENLSYQELSDQIGTINSNSYKQLTEIVRQRIESLSLYQ